jgi:hypothetical protein
MIESSVSASSSTTPTKVARYDAERGTEERWGLASVASGIPFQRVEQRSSLELDCKIPVQIGEVKYRKAHWLPSAGCQWWLRLTTHASLAILTPSRTVDGTDCPSPAIILENDHQPERGNFP